MSINYNSGIMTLYTRCGTHKNDQTKWRLPTIFWSEIENKVFWDIIVDKINMNLVQMQFILLFEVSITTVTIIVLCIITEIHIYLVKSMGWV